MYSIIARLARDVPKEGEDTRRKSTILEIVGTSGRSRTVQLHQNELEFCLSPALHLWALHGNDALQNVRLHLQKLKMPQPA